MGRQWGRHLQRVSYSGKQASNSASMCWSHGLWLGWRMRLWLRRIGGLLRLL
jgi:hypothetical protein